MIRDYVLYFFFYACLGWCVEVIHAALKTGKFVNRGFLNGCVCPVYGVGVVLILLCLTPINRNVFVLFIASVALTTALEFVTGWVLEALFHTKWWDYGKEHFQIKGYVCLKYSLLWGLACVIVVDLVHPQAAYVVSKLPAAAAYAIIGVAGAIFVADFVATLVQLRVRERHYRALDAVCAALKAPSSAIGGKLSEATLELVQKRNALHEKLRSSRLYKAFPEQIRKRGCAQESDEAEERAQKGEDGQ